MKNIKNILYIIHSYIEKNFVSIKYEYEKMFNDRKLTDHGKASCQGKVFETIISKYFDLALKQINPNNKFVLSSNYTSKWDAIIEYIIDGQSNVISVSIKNHKGKGLALGDINRNKEIDEDFILIKGIHDYSKLFSIEFFLIPKENWKVLFSYWTKEYQNKWKILFDIVKNDKENDCVWKKERKDLQNEWKSNSNSLIQINPKRDHKSQRRIQCGMNEKQYISFIENSNISVFYAN